MDGIWEWLHMGGYAGFVWSAYGLSALLLVGVLWHSLRQLRRRERELALLNEAKLSTSAK